MSSQKYKLKAADADRPSFSGKDVCELLVENGFVYKDDIVCFVDQASKDRSSEDLLWLKTVSSRGAVIFFIRCDNLYLVGFKLLAVRVMSLALKEINV